MEAANLLNKITVDSVDVWGPVPDIIEKKSDYYYFNLYLQSNNRSSLHLMLSTFTENVDSLKTKNKVRWYLDVDPIE
jgi:primosomal protein N' (replication factor Y)